MNGCFINEYILALKISFVQILQLQYVLIPPTLKTKLETVFLLSLANICLMTNEPSSIKKINLSNLR